MNANEARRLMRKVLRRLERRHGPRTWDGPDDAVDELVATILSQNTSDANSSAGYRRLKRRFRKWKSVADAPVEEVERCIRICGLSRIKAPRIQSILRRIRQERGEIDLADLAELPPAEAYRRLMRFEGVGPKTALCVLLFALGMPVFPVDTHIYRIAGRLGLLPPGTAFQKAHEHLTPRIDPPSRYATHILLIAHGRDTCRARNPKCRECALRDLCPYGRDAMARG